MPFAEVSVPDVPTDSSQILLHHQSIFPVRLKDAHDKEAPTTSYRGDTRCWWRRNFSAHWSSRADRYTGCRSRIVHGVPHDRRLWWSLLLSRFRPSTSAIMSLTAFAVKSLSLRSDIRFRASCTEADDGVDTDVIRAACQGMYAPCWFAVSLCPGYAVLEKVSSEASCEDPTVVCESSCPCGVPTFCPRLADFPGDSAVL